LNIRGKEIIIKSINQNKEEILMKVTPDMTIGELIRLDENIIPILMRAGMHCIGCPSAQGESIAEAAMVHGIDGNMLVAQINDFLENK
jgi:hybrid cluster-associated redox disulfide protein